MDESLQRLILRKNGITDVGMRYLAEALASHESIEVLDVSENPLSVYGLHHIRQLLGRNRQICDVILENIETDDPLDLENEIRLIRKKCHRNRKYQYRHSKMRKVLKSAMSLHCPSQISATQDSTLSSIGFIIASFASNYATQCPPGPKSDQSGSATGSASREVTGSVASDHSISRRARRRFMWRRARLAYKKFLLQIEGDFYERPLSVSDYQMLKRMCCANRWRKPLLEVSVYSAKGLRKVSRSVNAYCEVILIDAAGYILDVKHTGVVPRSTNPTWGKLEENRMSGWAHLDDPMQSKSLRIQVWHSSGDLDSTSRPPVFLGQVSFDLDMVRKKTKQLAKTEKLLTDIYATFGHLPPGVGPRRRHLHYVLQPRSDRSSSSGESVSGSVCVSLSFFDSDCFDRMAQRVFRRYTRLENPQALLTISQRSREQAEDQLSDPPNMLGVPLTSPLLKPLKHARVCAGSCARKFGITTHILRRMCSDIFEIQRPSMRFVPVSNEIGLGIIPMIFYSIYYRKQGHLILKKK
eukprot:1000184_1